MIRPAELIQRKRDGEELPDDELAELILGYARGHVPDYQMAAFCMAVYFRGLSPRQFDGNGNYTFGLTEQSMFHEIDPDSIDRPRGMDITVVTTATTDEEGRALLRKLGFPFKEA